VADCVKRDGDGEPWIKHMSEPAEEVDIQALIRALAATWVDPWWVYEAVAVEQDRLRAEAQRRLEREEDDHR
jgi:hypothetical protein